MHVACTVFGSSCFEMSSRHMTRLKSHDYHVAPDKRGFTVYKLTWTL